MAGAIDLGIKVRFTSGSQWIVYVHTLPYMQTLVITALQTEIKRQGRVYGQCLIGVHQLL